MDTNGTFNGFGPEAVAFYADLATEGNNSRAWFTANRDRYETHVRAPMERLLADVAEEFGDGQVFRPHRDVRFSRDKSPYKTHCGAVAGRDGPIAYYVQIGADGLLAASGMYDMRRDQHARLYQAIDDPVTGPRLEELVSEARAAGLEVWGSELKTAPRGYPRDHPRVALLRHKRMVVSRAWPPGEWLTTRASLERVVEVWRAAAGLNDWLRRHVGASTLPPDRRP